MSQYNNQPQTSSSSNRDTDESKGMIIVNDLVYKLEPDLSVAVNKTHKNHFFQQTSYENNQPATCILNSGADYIDCRKSFLRLQVNLSCKSRDHYMDEVKSKMTEYDQGTRRNYIEDVNDDFVNSINDSFVIDGLFGPNGSILNLIDTVTVTTRSGDELSRCSDLGMLSNMMLPLAYGDDWKKTVGQGLGFGDRLYGRNSTRKHPLSDKTYTIPLYLLSPIFQYNRLMPAMLMSGLRIQITWHTAAKAFAQVVTRCPTADQQLTMGQYGRVSGAGHQLRPMSWESNGFIQTEIEKSNDRSLDYVPREVGVDTPVTKSGSYSQNAIGTVNGDQPQDANSLTFIRGLIGYDVTLKKPVTVSKIYIPVAMINEVKVDGDPRAIPLRYVTVHRCASNVVTKNDTLTKVFVAQVPVKGAGLNLTDDGSFIIFDQFPPFTLETNLGINEVYRIAMQVVEGDKFRIDTDTLNEAIYTKTFSTTYTHYDGWYFKAGTFFTPDDGLNSSGVNSNESLSGQSLGIIWSGENPFGAILVSDDAVSQDNQYGSSRFHMGQGNAELVSWPNTKYDDENVGNQAKSRKISQITPECPVFHDPLSNFWGTGLDERVLRPPSKAPNLQKTVQRTTGGIVLPGYKYNEEDSDIARNWLSPFHQTDIQFGNDYGGAWIQFLQNPDFVESYTIERPEFSLCSVQLSDMIQRKLNEWSAVNGLEIVYCEYDQTSSPIRSSANGASVYTEVRKSASRALGAYARVVPMYKDTKVERMVDSNMSHFVTLEDKVPTKTTDSDGKEVTRDGGAKGWLDYQWQLGSLYFPQQKVTGSNPSDFDPLAYAYTLEATENFSNRKNCMLKLHYDEHPESGGHSSVVATTHMKSYYFNPAQAPPDTLSLEKQYIYGRPGSFSGGGHVVSVSLERSPMFNLSGIPINNSRVLALRGNYSSATSSISDAIRMVIYLKYVKLARIFLNNVEVEQ